MGTAYKPIAGPVIKSPCSDIQGEAQAVQHFDEDKKLQTDNRRSRSSCNVASRGSISNLLETVGLTVPTSDGGVSFTKKKRLSFTERSPVSKRNSIIKRFSHGLGITKPSDEDLEYGCFQVKRRPGVYILKIDPQMDKAHKPRDMSEGHLRDNLAMEHQDMIDDLVDAMSGSIIPDAVECSHLLDEHGHRQRFGQKNWEVKVCQAETSKFWIEYIDRNTVAPEDYMSQFDVHSRSPDTIETLHRTLTFPEGVAVEQLHFHDGKDLLFDQCPETVRKLIKMKGLEHEYASLVDEINMSRSQLRVDFKCKDIAKIIGECQNVWIENGVRVFICKKEDYENVTNGKEIRKHSFRWLEFCDLEQIANYLPPRARLTDAEMYVLGKGEAVYNS